MTFVTGLVRSYAGTDVQAGFFPSDGPYYNQCVTQKSTLHVRPNSGTPVRAQWHLSLGLHARIINLCCWPVTGLVRSYLGTAVQAQWQLLTDSFKCKVLALNPKFGPQNFQDLRWDILGPCDSNLTWGIMRHMDWSLRWDHFEPNHGLKSDMRLYIMLTKAWIEIWYHEWGTAWTMDDLWPWKSSNSWFCVWTHLDFNSICHHGWIHGGSGRPCSSASACWSAEGCQDPEDWLGPPSLSHDGHVPCSRFCWIHARGSCNLTWWSFMNDTQLQDFKSWHDWNYNLTCRFASWKMKSWVGMTCHLTRWNHGLNVWNKRKSRLVWFLESWVDMTWTWHGHDMDLTWSDVCLGKEWANTVAWPDALGTKCPLRSVDEVKDLTSKAMKVQTGGSVSWLAVQDTWHVLKLDQARLF